MLESSYIILLNIQFYTIVLKNVELCFIRQLSYLPLGSVLFRLVFKFLKAFFISLHFRGNLAIALRHDTSGLSPECSWYSLRTDRFDRLEVRYFQALRELLKLLGLLFIACPLFGLLGPHSQSSGGLLYRLFSAQLCLFWKLFLSIPVTSFSLNSYLCLLNSVRPLLPPSLYPCPKIASGKNL